MSVCRFFHPSICQCNYLSVNIIIYDFLCLSIYLYLSSVCSSFQNSLSISLSTYFSFSISINVSVYIFYLSLYLSSPSSIKLSVFLPFVERSLKCICFLPPTHFARREIFKDIKNVPHFTACTGVVADMNVAFYFFFFFTTAICILPSQFLVWINCVSTFVRLLIIFFGPTSK